MLTIKQAVILAGGRGIRLAPITDNLPKPMVDINGKPFIQRIIEKLKDQHAREAKNEIFEDEDQVGAKKFNEMRETKTGFGAKGSYK